MAIPIKPWSPLRESSPQVVTNKPYQRYAHKFLLLLEFQVLFAECQLGLVFFASSELVATATLPEGQGLLTARHWGTTSGWSQPPSSSSSSSSSYHTCDVEWGLLHRVRKEVSLVRHGLGHGRKIFLPQLFLEVFKPGVFVSYWQFVEVMLFWRSVARLYRLGITFWANVCVVAMINWNNINWANFKVFKFPWISWH